MNLKCNKCHHEWSDADITDSTPMVQCEECFAVMPVAVAKQHAVSDTIPEAPHAAPPRYQAPPSPPAVGPDSPSLFPTPQFDDNAPIPAPVPPSLRRGAPDEDTFGVPILDLPDAQPRPLNLPPPESVPSPTLNAFDQTVAPGNISQAPTFIEPGVGNISQAPTFIEPTPDAFSQTVMPQPSTHFPSQPPTQPPPSGPPTGFSQTMVPPSIHGAPTQVPGSMSSAPTSGFDPTMMPTNAGGPPTQPGGPVSGAGMSDLFERPGGVPSQPTATAPGGAAPISRAEPSAASKAANVMNPKEIDLTGQSFGGFTVRKMLGAGGMGAVCLARQNSLDRDVAVKILPGRMASNPDLLVRFTREALSAAQLTHHNIVQVYDVGSDQDIHYISMEFVRGENLGTMVRKEGRLNPDDAGGYILQAARGLKYAHDRGVIHRDIKPDNIMVNEHGIVKIADMGLAKMKGVAEEITRGDNDNELLKRAKGDLTMASVAMGTPAYMPPEQARDASTVDHRADQYSLGCTLYYLIAGKAPYSGSTAFEIMSKHQTEPLPPLEGQVGNLPPGLSQIVIKMMEKSPEDRYPNMSEAIRDIEVALGVESQQGTYTPREAHMRILEKEQAAFYAAPLLKVRGLVVKAFFAIALLTFLAGVFTFSGMLTSFAMGLLVITPLANFVLDGILHRTHLFRRVRSVFFGMSLKGWAFTIGATLLAAIVLIFLDMILPWAAAAIVAVALAAGYQFGLISRLRKQQTGPMHNMQEMLKQLRVRGVGEDAIQDFVCRFSGRDWEEFFELIFGYEAMTRQRVKWAAAEQMSPRRKFGVWRDPVARWLDNVEVSRKEARDKAALRKVEIQRLKSKGVSDKDAAAQADLEATKVFEGIKVAAAQADKKAGVEAKPAKVKKVAEPGTPTAIGKMLQMIRLALGGVVLLLWALYFFKNLLPPSIAPVMGFVNSLPIPQNVWSILQGWYGLGAGVGLLVSAMSSRLIAGALALGGGAMIVLSPYIGMIPGVPKEVVANGLFIGAGVLAAGIVMMGLGKVRTGRF